MKTLIVDISETLEARYACALADFDWHHAQPGADFMRRCSGRASLAALRVLQAQVDPDGALWLAAAPNALGMPQPVVAFDEVIPVPMALEA
jgi:hypothetical protein